MVLGIVGGAGQRVPGGPENFSCLCGERWVDSAHLVKLSQINSLKDYTRL